MYFNMEMVPKNGCSGKYFDLELLAKIFHYISKDIYNISMYFNEPWQPLLKEWVEGGNPIISHGSDFSAALRNLEAFPITLAP